jgi:hypothetical protein
MNIDRSRFLMLTATLAAAGAAGGWVLRDQDVLAVLDPAPRDIVARGQPTAPPEPLPPLPTCDDSIGEAAACPPIGPAAEGMCSNVAARRCADFKLSFKPRVAENAVACILRLKGNDLCDASRANMCGHAALMVACQPPDTYTSDGAGIDVSTAVTDACDAVAAGCGQTPLSPTKDDCRRTLAGMSEAGRAGMISCMAEHCGDRGLVGCEALSG